MTADRVAELFDGEAVGPDTRNVPLVGGAGGGLPEYHAGPGAYTYFAGGSMPLGEANEVIDAAGPSGYLLAGGARRRRGRRHSTRRRRQRGGLSKRVGKGRRNSSFKLNLRATIRLRSRSRI